MLYNKKKWVAGLFLIPFAFFIIVFILVPAIMNVMVMFRGYGQDGRPYYNFINDIYTIVGWRNVELLFKNQFFWSSIGNTFILVGFVIVFQVGLALLLALLVNGIKRFANVYRIIFFMPIVLSAVALGTIYRMFITDGGLFSVLFGIEKCLPVNDFFALFIVMLPVIWQYIGFYFVILLTGLAGIPDDVNEAAALDGANALQKAFFITLPMLWNVLRTCVVLAITGALKVFDFPHMAARDGDPLGQTYFMGTFNNSLYSNNLYGQTAFYSLLIVFVGMAVSIVCNLVLKENKDI